MTYYRRPNVEKGTNRDDVINGTNRKDIVFAKNGDDIINTGGGNDIIYAGKGDDIIHAGSGNDLVFAGSGDDVVFAGSGWDEVYGGRGNDTVFGGSGNDLIFGDKGDDQLFGESGRDVLLGGKGDDTLSGGTGNDILVGGSGCDTAVFDDSIFNFRFFDLGFFGFYVVHDGELDIDALFGIEKLQFDDFTVFIDGRNNAPFAFDDEAATDADMVLTIPGEQLLNNDFDFDGDDLTIVSVDDTNTLGTVTLNAAGEVVYDTNGQFNFLNVGQTDIDTFEYTVSDGNGGFDTALVTVTITGVNNNNNNAPDAVDDMATTDEDTAVDINVLGNDLDIDNDTLTIIQVDGQAISEGQSVTISSGAIVSLAGGLLNYDPVGQFEALAVGDATTDSFTYTISDGNGGSDTATVNVNIDGVNDAPAANDDSFQLTEDEGNVGGNVLDNDTDVDNGDVLTVTELNGQALGTGINVISDGGRTSAGVVVEADGTFTFATNVTSDPVSFQDLAAGETDTVTLNYTIADGNGGTDTASVTVTITGLNDGPVAADDTGSTDEDTPTTINVLDNDTDIDASDVLSVAEIEGQTVSVGDSVTLASGAIVTLNGDGTLNYDPTGQFDSLQVGDTATDSFEYTVSDGNGGADTATVTVNIDGVNDAPVAADDFGETTENGVVILDLLANDVDVENDTLTVTDVDGFAPGELVLVTTDGGRLGAAVFEATGAFAFVTDGILPTGEVIGFDNLAEGDVDSATLTYSISDGNGGTDSAFIFITLNGVNDAPDAIDDNFSTDEETAVSGNVLDDNGNGADFDIDNGDTFAITAVNGSAADLNQQITLGSGAMLIFNDDGTFTYDPTGTFDFLSVGDVGTDTFTYTITDSLGASDTATVTINIGGVNDDPTAADDTVTTDEDTVLQFAAADLLANDVDIDQNDTLMVVSVDGALTQGTVSFDGTDIIYDPDGQFEFLAVGQTATDTFTYTIEDNNGGMSTATVTVNITGVNDAPIAVDDTVTVGEDGPSQLFDILGNDIDVDGDPLEIIAITLSDLIGSSGVAGDPPDQQFGYGAGGQLEFLSVGEVFTQTTTYSIRDGNGGTDSATITINVEGANDGPVAADDLNGTIESGTIRGGRTV